MASKMTSKPTGRTRTEQYGRTVRLQYGALAEWLHAPAAERAVPGFAGLMGAELILPELGRSLLPEPLLLLLALGTLYQTLHIQMPPVKTCYSAYF